MKSGLKIINRPLLLFSAPMFFLFSAHLSGEPVRVYGSGEWAEYHDSRGELDFYRIYWAHNIDEGGVFIAIRNVDNRSGENVNYMIILGGSAEGEIELKQISGLTEDQSPEFVQSIADAMNFLEVSSGWSPEDGEKNIGTETSGVNETFHFAGNLPLFGFDSISVGAREPVYKLVSAGSLSPETDMERFFSMPVFGAIEYNNRRGLGIPEKREELKSLYEFQISLDENWKANNELGFPGYWLPLYSYRDSQIMLEKENVALLEEAGINGIEGFIRKTLYLNGERILMDTMKMSEKQAVFNISYYLIDSGGKRNYVDRTLWIQDGLLYILNFSSFADIFEQNEDYYRKIIGSFRGNIR